MFGKVICIKDYYDRDGRLVFCNGNIYEYGYCEFNIYKMGPLIVYSYEVWMTIDTGYGNVDINTSYDFNYDQKQEYFLYMYEYDKIIKKKINNIIK
jgi:hypothetical protein